MFSAFPCFLLVDDFCFCLPLFVCCFGVVFVGFLLVFSGLFSFWFIVVCGSLVRLWDLDLVFIGVGGFVMSLIICASLFCGVFLVVMVVWIGMVECLAFATLVPD